VSCLCYNWIEKAVYDGGRVGVDVDFLLRAELYLAYAGSRYNLPGPSCAVHSDEE
jgi:hypothetical protein